MFRKNSVRPSSRVQRTWRSFLWKGALKLFWRFTEDSVLVCQPSVCIWCLVLNLIDISSGQECSSVSLRLGVSLLSAGTDWQTLAEVLRCDSVWAETPHRPLTADSSLFVSLCVCWSWILTQETPRSHSAWCRQQALLEEAGLNHLCNNTIGFSLWWCHWLETEKLYSRC